MYEQEWLRKDFTMLQILVRLTGCCQYSSARYFGKRILYSSVVRLLKVPLRTPSPKLYTVLVNGAQVAQPVELTVLSQSRLLIVFTPSHTCTQ